MPRFRFGVSSYRTATGALIGAAALALSASGSPVVAADVPSSLADRAFWQLVTESSEPGGTFASNNWISNELLFQTVLPDLTRRVARGGVYVGVGPDQNFTYVVGLRPKIAFIVDIRRQNMLQHLMYKALIELSPTRSEFLSRLFSRPRRSGADAGATAAALLASAAEQPRDEALYHRTVVEMLDHLRLKRGFALNPDDERTIEYIFQTFFDHGPNITYAPLPGHLISSGSSMVSTSVYPTFTDLMTETDGQGVNRSYLANEDNYRALREMQQKNLIVPVVGDFAGQKALRTVGRWLRDRGAKVTTFYTSNVEQYLFQNGVWREYYDNVAAMPIDANAMFIRTFFPGQFRTQVFVRGALERQTVPELPPSSQSMRLPSGTFVCAIPELLTAIKGGRVTTYFEVIEMSKQGACRGGGELDQR